MFCAAVEGGAGGKAGPAAARRTPPEMRTQGARLTMNMSLPRAAGSGPLPKSGIRE